MKRIIQIFSSTLKAAAERKKSTGLIVLVLTVSIAAALFLTAYGYESRQEQIRSDFASKTWLLNIAPTDLNAAEGLKNKDSERYGLFSFFVTGESYIYKYSNQGEIKYNVKIGSELLNQSMILTYEVKATPEEDREALSCSSEGSLIHHSELIGDLEFFVVGMGKHNMESFLEGKPISYLVSRDDFSALGIAVDNVLITTKAYLAEDESEELLRFVSEDCGIEVTDIIPPAIKEDKSIEKLQLVVAFMLLCLSSLNVLSVFLYISEKRRTEYGVYRICGAAKSYVLADLSAMIFFLTAISFAAANGLYRLLLPLLKSLGVGYSSNAYVTLVTLVLTLAPMLAVAVCVGRRVNKNENH